MSQGLATHSWLPYSVRLCIHCPTTPAPQGFPLSSVARRGPVPGAHPPITTTASLGLGELPMPSSWHASFHLLMPPQTGRGQSPGSHGDPGTWHPEGHWACTEQIHTHLTLSAHHVCGSGQGQFRGPSHGFRGSQHIHRGTPRLPALSQDAVKPGPCLARTKQLAGRCDPYPVTDGQCDGSI